MRTIYIYGLDLAQARVNYPEAKSRDAPPFPEIIFHNVILVGKKDCPWQHDPVDRLQSIIYPAGCSNLDAPEVLPVGMDFTHSSYDNAGYVTNLRLSDCQDFLLGTVKVGPQHILIDRNGRSYGSAYASAWATLAEYKAGRPENIISGKTYQDFIPEKVRQKFFPPDKPIPPFTSVSVEMDWNSPPELIENVYHIKRYSIVRLSWLINTNPGQQQARINPDSYTINSNQYNQSINMNQITNRSLPAITELITPQGQQVQVFTENIWDIVLKEQFKMAEQVFPILPETESKAREAALSKEGRDMQQLCQRMCTACAAQQKSTPEGRTQEVDKEVIDAMVQAIIPLMETLANSLQGVAQELQNQMGAMAQTLEEVVKTVAALVEEVAKTVAALVEEEQVKMKTGEDMPSTTDVLLEKGKIIASPADLPDTRMVSSCDSFTLNNY